MSYNKQSCRKAFTASAPVENRSATESRQPLRPVAPLLFLCAPLCFVINEAGPGCSCVTELVVWEGLNALDVRQHSCVLPSRPAGCDAGRAGRLKEGWSIWKIAFGTGCAPKWASSRRTWSELWLPPLQLRSTCLHGR
eukprot:363193-Chlamydomonas_euryale.AAC.15